MGAQQSQIKSLLDKKKDLLKEKEHHKADLLLPDIGKKMAPPGYVRNQTLGDMLKEQQYMDRAKNRIVEIDQLIYSIDTELSKFPPELIKKVKKEMNKLSPMALEFGIKQAQSRLDFYRAEVQNLVERGGPIEKINQGRKIILEIEKELQEYLEQLREGYTYTETQTHID